MNNIETILQSIETLKNASIMRIFKSKKNTVCLIELDQSPYVLKLFSKENINGFQNELKILSKSNTSFHRAKMICYDEEYRYILLDYIKGSNVCDLINHHSISFKKKTIIIKELAYWFNQFHNDLFEKNSYIIHGDANLRNFLFNRTVIGLDYEEINTGETIQDIAHICASILTTHPQYTQEKKELEKQFIQSYQELSHKNLPTISEEIKKAIQKINKRRKKRN